MFGITLPRSLTYFFCSLVGIVGALLISAQAHPDPGLASTGLATTCLTSEQCPSAERLIAQASSDSSRRYSITEVGNYLYELLPDFPRENEYTSSETGQPAVNNTLASRMVNYHTLVKGRAPIYRLDWKLTLADYLGVNERLNLETYPGATTLTENPARSDIEIIQSFNRAEREEIVSAFVEIFNQSDSIPDQAEPSETDSPTPSVQPTPAPTIHREPGSADLLMP